MHLYGKNGTVLLRVTLEQNVEIDVTLTLKVGTSNFSEKIVMTPLNFI